MSIYSTDVPGFKSEILTCCYKDDEYSIKSIIFDEISNKSDKELINDFNEELTTEYITVLILYERFNILEKMFNENIIDINKSKIKINFYLALCFNTGEFKGVNLFINQGCFLEHEMNISSLDLEIIKLIKDLDNFDDIASKTLFNNDDVKDYLKTVL